MSAPKILLCRRMPTELLQQAEQAGKVQIIARPQEADEGPAPRDWLLENLKGVAGAIIMLSEKVDDEFLDAAGPSLKVISTMSVGYDHIDVAAVKKRGVRIGNTPHVLDQAVAELTLTLALMTTRQIAHATRVVREGEWSKNPWTPLSFCGPSLQGKTIGFVGFGNISQSLAHLLVPFRPARLLYTTSKPKPFDLGHPDFAPLKRGNFPIDRIEVTNQPDALELAAQSDVVFVLASLNPSTKHMVNDQFLSRMKSTAYIINASRGPLIDTEALARAISNGQIAGAGLDVLENEPNIPATHPLLQPDCADRVVLLPHIGSATNEARVAMADLTVNNLLGALGLRAEAGKENEMDAEV
ncbi:uncharacterized protein PFL1_00796 [Pseudozyma flocculosa PF-1]|uniref:Related to glycerate dehydrogenase n=1 Tax=Pseudozyma flocculosa TaxID=84751 RepID=A0A5C3F496_9BASI|nr:uncharacterized protein PFL1_00796 [Pseudozyma flocculosa PF-1]EPQ31461.1 hypothetical protein PFL1_00796 [Pseudozyma flocculosa PF-1]SPO38756.1 related to glycerate dehydrogenase [Pseudozyma flocculosa]